MKSLDKIMLALSGLAFASAVSLGPTSAAVIPYPNSGTENLVVINTYTAAVTGAVTATVAAPNGAGLTNELGYSVNGGGTIFTGLDNRAPGGNSFSFGVTAGDILRLFIRTSAGDVWSSDISLNPDGVNHFYSVAYTGAPNLGPLVPLGRYVSFEDLPGGGDFNYNDFNLVLTNISAAVPQASTWAMMLIGFAGLALVASRRREGASAAA